MISIKTFEVNYFSENTYLLYDETREAVIIDCGCASKEEKQELSDFISQNGLTLKRNLCTHLHLDHAFGNEFILKTYGLYPEAHKGEVSILPSLEEQAKLFGLKDAVKDIPIQKYLVGGETIRFGESELMTLSVPGHSPAGLAFYSSKNGYVFVGDSLFAGSIGRTDLWGGNHDVLVAAIKDKLFALPDDTIVYPGHGSETTIANERINNPYL